MPRSASDPSPARAAPRREQTRDNVKLLRERRFHVCLSLWDPHIPVLHDSLFGGHKLKMVNVATQARPPPRARAAADPPRGPAAQPPHRHGRPAARRS